MSARTVTFFLNGKPVHLHVNPERLLIDVLRRDLGLTGTKEGCDRRGECWTCAVQLEGKAALSCLLPMEKVEGRSVTTIEGVGLPTSLHPLQRGLWECGAVQCGFCIPGVVMTAKALLDANPHPTREEVSRRLSRNLCRCTGYHRIVEGVLRAAQTDQPVAAPKWGTVPVVGESVLRPDGPKKALGLTRFASDLRRPGMLFAAVLRSPHLHAEIEMLDVADALRSSGVRAVLTARDVPGDLCYGSFRKDQPVLAKDRVRFNGEPVAVVAAQTEEAARTALDAIQVRYRPLPPVLDPEEALSGEAPALHDGGNLCASRRIVRGDVGRGFQEAAVVEERVFRTPFIEHAYLEPEAGLAFVASDGTIEVHSCTQAPHGQRSHVARVLGLPPERVRIVQTPLGGAFGGKSDMATEGLLALLAQRLNLPVSLVYSREDSFRASTKRHPFYMRYRIGAEREGRLIAIHAEILGNTGAYTTVGPGVLDRACTAATGPYECPNVLVEGKMAFTNAPPCGAMRGFGAPQVHFALESMVDILAGRLGLDPLEVRLRNAFGPGSTTATGQVLGTGTGLRECLRALEGEYRYAKEAEKSPGPDGPIRRGIGLGSLWYGLGTVGQVNPAGAEVELRQDGTFQVRVGIADMGPGSDTMFGQIAAETLGVPFGQVEVLSGDTGLTQISGHAHAGRTIQIVGRAVVRAAEELRERLRTVAAQALEEKPEEVRLSGGHLESMRYVGQRLSWSRVADLALRSGVETRCYAEEGSAVTPLDPETGQGIPHETYTWGAQMAEVDVNVETGNVKVVRVVAAHDVGKAINPDLARAQIEGGVVIGLGFALKEEFRPNETRCFGDYRIPRLKDAPEMVSLFVEVPEPLAPFGAKAVAESASVPTAPAILNAVEDAIGVRITDLPITPEKILRALEGQPQKRRPGPKALVE